MNNIIQFYVIFDKLDNYNNEEEFESWRSLLDILGGVS